MGPPKEMIGGAKGGRNAEQSTTEVAGLEDVDMIRLGVV
jgi:hypothetical protein